MVILYYYKFIKLQFLIIQKICNNHNMKDNEFVVAIVKFLKTPKCKTLLYFLSYRKTFFFEYFTKPLLFAFVSLSESEFESSYGEVFWYLLESEHRNKKNYFMVYGGYIFFVPIFKFCIIEGFFPYVFFGEQFQ